MKKNFALLALTGILTLASCGGNNSDKNNPTCPTGQNLVNGTCVTPTPTDTTGAVSFNNPNGYTVTIKNQSGAVISDYSKLTPGSYTATFSKDGYVSQDVSFAVAAGQTTPVTAPTLSKAATVSPAGAYYVDSNNAVHPITTDMLKNAGSNFVFYAWLENKNEASVGSTTTSDSILSDGTAGNLLKRDVAPINNQNLAAAYVGYKAPDGKTYPVVGAAVRWDIVQATSQTNVRFAAADDGNNAPGAVPLYVSDQAMEANTFTNAASNTANAQFPSSPQYPLTNKAHLSAPGIDGVTWAALWVPDQKKGEADISVVASIGNTEINKTTLHKIFAPSAHLTIKKTVDSKDAVLPNNARNFTITVKNDGQGPATGIKLSDVYSGQADINNYVLGNVTSSAATTKNDKGGFESTFDLAAGAEQTFTFTASGKDAGQYCDAATISSYTNGDFGEEQFVNPTDGSNQACMTVIKPELTILKQIADKDGNVLSNQNPTVAAGNTVYVKVTLTNNGSATATGVKVTDALNNNTTNASAYNLGTVTTNGGAAITQAGSGFTTAAQDIPAKGSVSYLIPATPTDDGKFCDTASFESGNAGTGSANACFNVATAKLQITKTNSASTVNPGGSYTSTITVTNVGKADAITTVNDLVGNNGATYLTPNAGGTYTLTGQPSGAVTVDSAAHTFNAGQLTIPAGGNLTLNVTTTVPAATAPGEYCNTATYNSTNAQPNSGQAKACITVAALLPTHIQSGDSVDPLKADGSTTSVITFTSWVERTANQNGVNNVWEFNYGANDPSNYGGAAGIFNFNNVHVYYDANPSYDDKTGIITSDYNHGQDITSQVTLSAASGTGRLTVTAPSLNMVPGSVVYIRSTVTAPAGSANAAGFQSVGRWVTTGSSDGVQKINQAAENTVTN